MDAAPLRVLTPVRYSAKDDDGYMEELDDEPQSPQHSPGGTLHPRSPRPPRQPVQRPPPLTRRSWKAAAADFALRPPEEPLFPEPELGWDVVLADHLADCPRPPYEDRPGDVLTPKNLEYNEVKYELARVTGCNFMIFGPRGVYQHVNFYAREVGGGGAEAEEERFFFAEVLDKYMHKREGTEQILTCMCSLDEEAGDDEQVGGVRDHPFAEARPWVVPVDYCQECGDEIKHPKDGGRHCIKPVAPADLFD